MPGLASRTTTLSRQQIEKMLAERRSGLWKPKETRDEANLSLEQMESTDYAITLNHRTCQFGVLNRDELKTQVKIWRTQGVVSHPYNIKPYEHNGKTYWMFVAQPPDLEKNSSMCPLAMACGILVNGFTYITPSKAVAEWVSKQLGC